MKKIAINGFGRIGRNVFKVSLEQEFNQKAEVVAINDLGDINNLAYLLQYDSVYRNFGHKVTVVQEEGAQYLQIGSLKRIRVYAEKDPNLLPWNEHDIDVVIESTGFFTSQETASSHIKAGAKRVVISAPAKDDQTPTVTPSLNEEALMQSLVTSNASCTTNATNPVVSVMIDTVGIQKAMLSTVHGYTASQQLVDGISKKDLREGRAAAMNLVPSSTGAAKAVGKTIKEMDGLFDGISVRVPVVAGSLIDLTFLAKRPTTVEEVNQALTQAAASPKWHTILAVTKDPLVSTDILGNPHASIVDLAMTRVVDGDLVKIMSWYDNEWGYSCMLMKHVVKVMDLL